MITGDAKTRTVKIGDRILSPARSQRLWNHSPDGFNWGYSGSGPAQLALALLLEFSDDNIAPVLYQKFKAEIIAELPMDKDFELSEDLVKDWIIRNEPLTQVRRIYGKKENNAP